MESKQVVGIIPARYGSTRLPGKPLLDICGEPMIQHVYKRAAEAEVFDRVIVATDDERIKERVENFGGEAVMTSTEHKTGTDRLAEAARRIEADIIVNIQGDEPLISPAMIEELVYPLLVDSTLVMSTLKQEIKDQEEVNNPDLVKVVTDKEGYALYFSRSPIPYLRNQETDSKFYKHIGLYAYQKSFLLKFAKLEATPLEQAESLEQLRALENGYRIKVVETEHASIGVDTEEDLKRVRNVMEEIENG
ncbi:3-deoxy-manno-octulosonate cytidylyltransferase [Acetohalobium arabaticum]|uniref:3-deoxy-manno-octulosonate cytidylyltransferase n=1 Tax=Acetohalobium arabaticum (strain ATCC 49924 / DSM 5501 / Z-7288) TaxID=574087 RepID=D9QTV0_ACEAZ|nr:3-deoxy-manno-octulosonate cytidylyltransferase [Acetohalobium arabaticum]ADL13671.1 3-deoxy-D-manno-octulosonatecytidylyltransferase [Acetohalobium arabaticum DSM 5501]